MTKIAATQTEQETFYINHIWAYYNASVLWLARKRWFQYVSCLISWLKAVKVPLLNKLQIRFYRGCKISFHRDCKMCAIGDRRRKFNADFRQQCQCTERKKNNALSIYPSLRNFTCLSWGSKMTVPGCVDRCLVILQYNGPLTNSQNHILSVSTFTGIYNVTINPWTALTNWGQDKMSTISQPTFTIYHAKKLRSRQNGHHFANDIYKFAFFNEIVAFRFEFHWNVFFGVKLTMHLRWFR